MVNVYNTLSRKTEPFKPLSGKKVGMYVCGPTVYGPGHIGHARTYIAFDLIRRYLEYRGFEVNYIVNITDVHDDMIKEANKQSITIFQLAEKNIPLFINDLESLGIKKPNKMPRVTEHIPEIIKMVETLEKGGFAYETEDGVYFSISKFKDYGQLSNTKVKKSVTGTRVETDKYEKENPMDFALWKKAKEGEPAWDSKWGKGRPGWHIECSAMSTKYLGNKFDIHGGAVDLVFPHHENEICQSEACFHEKPFVKYWLHAGFLNVNGEKMSKSLGNFITIPELLAKFDPRQFRYFISTLHYRSRVNFNDKAISLAAKNLEKWDALIQELLNVAELSAKKGKSSASEMKSSDYKAKKGSASEVKKIISEAEKRFIEQMDADFNLPNAWACLYDFQSKVNKLIASKSLSEKDVTELISFLKKLNTIFNFFEFEKKEAENLSKDISALVEQREKFRKEKNFAEADKIRDALKAKGIELLDTPDGVKWKKV